MKPAVDHRSASMPTIFAIACCLFVSSLSVSLAQQANEPLREPGLALRLYDIGEPLYQLVEILPGQTPNISTIIPVVDLDGRKRPDDFGTLRDRFISIVEGWIEIKQPGVYEFALQSDDGSDLWINGVKVVDHDGLHGPDEKREGKADLAAGFHTLRIRHFEEGGGERLALYWRPPGAAQDDGPYKDGFVIVPNNVLWCQKGEVKVTSPGRKRVVKPLKRGKPGDGQSLESVHPGYELLTLRPEGFEPRVGGMDWFSDGRLAICTWDAAGRVYIIDGVLGANPKPTVSLFAQGLAEPLGLQIVNDQIYVLQKQELTQLIDTNGDGVADEYRCVVGNWPVTDNFHEFAFGLTYKDGAFYANLAVAINPGGATTVPQIKGRGSVIKLSMDGTYEYVAGGLRTPNGIGLGPDDEIFITDNQGDWLPCSKLLHVKQGRFFNSYIKPDTIFGDAPVTPPVAWLPQGEIGNSPGNCLYLKDGLFKGQMLHCDITHGGIKRTFLEKINGAYQGCVFRFTQGLEAGTCRISVGPDGAIYAGGIGSTGNWGQEGKQRFGLQKLMPNGGNAFEMAAVRAKSNGMEIEFTEALPVGFGWQPEYYNVRQWRYEPTKEYGGPKLDETQLVVRSASPSTDRRHVFLELEGMKPGHVVYIQLVGAYRSETGRPLWSTEAWYTLNNIPTGAPGKPLTPPPPPPINLLSQREMQEGWKLLFDGKTLNGWRGYRKETAPPGWEVKDGLLLRTDSGGDIVTNEMFDNFELSLEWRISPGGNSGIFYLASEQMNYVWETAPEMQILDNDLHPDGRDPRTSAGANYALHAPPADLTLPVGLFNHARIVVRHGHVEHWLNGEKIVEYELGSADWTSLVAGSKFASMPHYGTVRKGHIVLQDHGDLVAFRNIKIRKLD